MGIFVIFICLCFGRDFRRDDRNKFDHDVRDRDFRRERSNNRDVSISEEYNYYNDQVRDASEHAICFGLLNILIILAVKFKLHFFHAFAI